MGLEQMGPLQRLLWWIKRNRYKAAKALNDFLIGLKNEASDSKETSRTNKRNGGTTVSELKIRIETEEYIYEEYYEAWTALATLDPL